MYIFAVVQCILHIAYSYIAVIYKKCFSFLQSPRCIFLWLLGSYAIFALRTFLSHIFYTTLTKHKISKKWIMLDPFTVYVQKIFCNFLFILEIKECKTYIDIQPIKYLSNKHNEQLPVAVASFRSVPVNTKLENV